MNNPLRILQTLDRHLAVPAEITLFGRAALALGYVPSPAAFAATHDVDAILPLAWLAAADGNLDFWEAQQRTNAELADPARPHSTRTSAVGGVSPGHTRPCPDQDGARRRKRSDP